MLVDAFTAVGGSQYVDSPGIGNYHTYLCDELVPFVDANYPTLPDAAHRGIQGKSSGGYGSMITPLLRPDLFGGLATHAGDALFEVCYARDFAPAARALRDAYGGSFDAFWEDFRSGRPVLSSPLRRAARQHLRDVRRLLVERRRHGRPAVRPRDRRARGRGLAALAALRPRACSRASRPTPRRCAACAAIWIDSGRNDEYHLELGATAFHREVVAAASPDDRVHFELFPGTHRGLTWRYPLSLAWLVERLTS